MVKKYKRGHAVIDCMQCGFPLQPNEKKQRRLKHRECATTQEMYRVNYPKYYEDNRHKLERESQAPAASTSVSAAAASAATDSEPAPQFAPPPSSGAISKEINSMGASHASPARVQRQLEWQATTAASILSVDGINCRQ